MVWNIFPYIGNNHPNWLSYFSEGLKPPTRKSCFQAGIDDVSHPSFPNFQLFGIIVQAPGCCQRTVLMSCCASMQISWAIAPNECWEYWRSPRRCLRYLGCFGGGKLGDATDYELYPYIPMILTVVNQHIHHKPYLTIHKLIYLEGCHSFIRLLTVVCSLATLGSGWLPTPWCWAWPMRSWHPIANASSSTSACFVACAQAKRRAPGWRAWGYLWKIGIRIPSGYWT